MNSKTNHKKVHIATFGCQMNQYDSSRMIGLLAGCGYEPVDDPEKADLILLNTCSVRERAAHKVYSHAGSLKPLKDRRPGLVIGVAGCLAQQEGQNLLDGIGHLDLVMGPGGVDALPELVSRAARGERVCHIPTPKGMSGLAPVIQPGLKAMVTIMTGCDNFCSYCVVPYLRGRENSRPAGEVLEEAERLVAGGAREITLLGQNVNSYRDPDEGEDFAGLLERASRISGVWRLRFTTSHPKDLSPRLIEAMAGIEKVMEGLHLPIQAGSDRVLKAMNRGYTSGEYLGKVEQLRRKVPGVALGGDMIVGFPGETPEDFQQTLAIMRRVGYDFLYSFKYSDRPFTKARKMAGKVAEDEKARRLIELQALQKAISLDVHRRLEGETLQVLVEGPAKKGAGLMTGRDRAGRAVNFPGGPELIGSLVEVLVSQGLVNSLMGRPLTDQSKGVLA